MKTFTNLKQNLFYLLSIFILISCSKEEVIPNIALSNTYTFENTLSSMGVFIGELNSLTPSEGYEYLELSSHLYVNHAKKQRLIKLPAGTQMHYINNGLPDFPEGTILVKTFFYNHNDNTPQVGRRIIETRFLILKDAEWNAATYVWNDEQTEAFLDNSGSTTQVSWVDKNGVSQNINYDIPSGVDCVTCHQWSGDASPIGPKLSNMNIDVVRNGQVINQLNYLQTKGLLENFDHTQVYTLPDFENSADYSLEERARAYFDLNCAHCHNPEAYCRKKPFDFRFDTPLENTTILSKMGPIVEVVNKGRMPLIGVTKLDENGLQLIVEYFKSIE